MVVKIVKPFLGALRTTFPVSHCSIAMLSREDHMNPTARQARVSLNSSRLHRYWYISSNGFRPCPILEIRCELINQIQSAPMKPSSNWNHLTNWNILKSSNWCWLDGCTLFCLLQPPGLPEEYLADFIVRLLYGPLEIKTQSPVLSLNIFEHPFTKRANQGY